MNKIKISLLILLTVVFLLPVFVSATTVSELQALINSLKAQLQQLESQLSQATQGTTAWCHDFNTNLKMGDGGDEVSNLYSALFKNGLVEERSSNFTNNFDEYVASAVSGFQEKYREEILTPVGLKHGTGFVGKLTRAKLNKLYGCGGSAIPNPTPTPKPISCPQYAPPLCESGLTTPGGTDTNGCVRPAKCVSKTPYGCGTTCTTDNNGITKCSSRLCICVAEGESLGAVVPGNTAQCCAGLVAQAPEGLVGGRGICVKSVSTASITVLSPNGGEKWEIGKTYKIKWTNTTNKYTVMEIIGNRGNDRVIIPSGDIFPPSQTSYNFTVPSSWQAGSDFKVMVSAPPGNYGHTITDSSDSSFSIVTAGTNSGVSVISPNGGENWKVGETHAITWDSSNRPASSQVTIKISDTRPTFNVLPNSATIIQTTNTGSYNWTIPSSIGGMNLNAGNVYKIKIDVEVGNVGIVTDSSDSTFSITSVTSAASPSQQLASILESAKFLLTQITELVKNQ